MTRSTADGRRSIIFHIGLEKTGTTSLQNVLFEQRAALLRAGVHYPARNKGFYKNNHAPLAAAYYTYDQQDFTTATSSASRDSVLASLRREIDRSAAPTVLISAEHFSSRFDRVKAARLRDDFSDFEPRIVVVLRSHAARLFSSYSTYVDAGGEADFNDYARALMHPDSPYLRIRETLSIWEDVFGRDRLDILDYDQYGDIIPIFTARYAPVAPDVLERPRPRDKVTLKPSAAEAVRQANIAISRRQGPLPHSLPAWMQRRYFQRRAADRIIRHQVACNDERWHLGTAEAATLDAIAAADRDWLAAEFGLNGLNGRPAAARYTVGDGGPPPDRRPAAHLAAALVSHEGWRWNLSTLLVRLAINLRRIRRPR